MSLLLNIYDFLVQSAAKLRILSTVQIWMAVDTRSYATANNSSIALSIASIDNSIIKYIFIQTRCKSIKILRKNLAKLFQE